MSGSADAAFERSSEFSHDPQTGINRKGAQERLRTADRAEGSAFIAAHARSQGKALRLHPGIGPRGAAGAHQRAVLPIIHFRA